MKVNEVAKYLIKLGLIASFVIATCFTIVRLVEPEIATKVTYQIKEENGHFSSFPDITFCPSKYSKIADVPEINQDTNYSMNDVDKLLPSWKNMIFMVQKGYVSHRENKKYFQIEFPHIK